MIYYLFHDAIHSCQLHKQNYLNKYAYDIKIFYYIF